MSNNLVIVSAGACANVRLDSPPATPIEVPNVYSLSMAVIGVTDEKTFLLYAVSTSPRPARPCGVRGRYEEERRLMKALPTESDRQRVTRTGACYRVVTEMPNP